MKVLVTGATGFVGRTVAERLLSDGHQVVATTRRHEHPADSLQWLTVPEIGPTTDWRAALQDVDAVIHLAARVHRLDERGSDPLPAYLHSNHAGTLRLARAAATADVHRFVFVSTIKVNGEATPDGRPFKSGDTPRPQDPYAVSKLQAEHGLQQVAREQGLPFTVLRPPLVYGPGVKANLLRLMGWISRGLPLPLGGIDNRRSLLCVDNLSDLIVTCLDHPAAVGRTLLASDGEDLSTPALVGRLARHLGRPLRLLPARWLPLRTLAGLAGRDAELERLTGSLQIDSSELLQLLGWQPPVRLDDGLQAMCHWYNGSDR